MLQLGTGGHERRLQRTQQKHVGDRGQVVGHGVEANRLGIQHAADHHPVDVGQQPVDDIGEEDNPPGAQRRAAAGMRQQRPQRVRPCCKGQNHSDSGLDDAGGS